MIGSGDNSSAENGDERVYCSRAGCESPATWNVNWRNPKIHSADRVKIWLACSDHVDFLHDYLTTHNFPVVVTPLDVHIAVVP